MNRRDACRTLLGLALAALAGPVAAQRQRKRYAWAELTAAEQETLAPLKPDWENLGPDRRRKWIGIARRWPAMTPQERERVQKRMQRWANLSPEQRQRARENYRRMAKASAEKRRLMRKQWAEYQAQKTR